MNPTINHTTQALEIALPGDLLSTNVEKVRAELFALIDSDAIKDSPWKLLCLDLTGAQMIDSMGLNLIVSLVRLLQRRGARLQVRIANSNVERTFLFTRLDRQLELMVA